MYFLITVIFGSLLTLSATAQENSLHLTGSNYSAYHVKDKRLRHHRYELSLRQEASFGFRLKSVMDGRLRWDSVLMDNKYAVHRDYPETVRKDELFEGDAREAYLDYLGDSYRVKLGRQLVDWVGSSSPAQVNLITAVDVRTGVSGEAGDFVLPVDAASLSHDFLFDGSLEWLLVPYGNHHIYPTEDNGFGYYDYLKENVGERSLTIEDESIEKDQDETEGGLRYQATFGALDYSLFAYRGHQRDPAFKADAGLSSVRLTRYYPRVDTYGTMAAYSSGAFVYRAGGFYEPRRKPTDPEIAQYPEGSVSGGLYDQRYVASLGLDYLINKHLKIYTDHFFNRRNTVIPDNATREEKNLEGFEDTYFGMMRLSNGTIEGVELRLDSTFSAPYRSQIYEPSLRLAFWNNYNFAMGYRAIYSRHSQSDFEPIKDADIYFMRLEAIVDALKLVKEEES